MFKIMHTFIAKLKPKTESFYKDLVATRLGIVELTSRDNRTVLTIKNKKPLRVIFTGDVEINGKNLSLTSEKFLHLNPEWGDGSKVSLVDIPMYNRYMEYAMYEDDSPSICCDNHNSFQPDYPSIVKTLEDKVKDLEKRVKELEKCRQ